MVPTGKLCVDDFSSFCIFHVHHTCKDSTCRYCKAFWLKLWLDCTRGEFGSLKCSSETWKKWSAGHISFNASNSFRKKHLIGVPLLVGTPISPLWWTTHSSHMPVYAQQQAGRCDLFLKLYFNVCQTSTCNSTNLLFISFVLLCCAFWVLIFLSSYQHIKSWKASFQVDGDHISGYAHLSALCHIHWLTWHVLNFISCLPGY